MSIKLEGYFRKFIKGIMFLWIENVMFVWIFENGQFFRKIAPALYMIQNFRWPFKNKDGFSFNLKIEAFSCDK